MAWTGTLGILLARGSVPQHIGVMWMIGSVVGGISGAFSHAVYSLSHPTAPVGEFRRPGLPDLDRQVRESWGAKVEASEESANEEELRVEE